MSRPIEVFNIFQKKTKTLVHLKVDETMEGSVVQGSEKQGRYRSTRRRGVNTKMTKKQSIMPFEDRLF